MNENYCPLSSPLWFRCGHYIVGQPTTIHTKMITIDTYGTSSFCVSYAEAWVDMSEIWYEGVASTSNTATLYGLRSNERRKGYASKVMDYVCHIADMYNIELMLHASADDFSSNPPDLLTQDELVAFYKRRGFVFKETSGRVRIGYRTPVIKPIEYDVIIDSFFKEAEEEYIRICGDDYVYEQY